MSFIDELTIHAKAGKGGDGAVRWRHEKFREFGGPSGGDGGNGGDVYVRAVRDVHLLSKYRHNPSFEAQNGGGGEKNDLHGENGEDKYIDLPVGSIIRNLKTENEYSLMEEGASVRILKGGQGGRGNASFKSSTNQFPEEWTPGGVGEEADFSVEIELIADIGLIGLPSAGKTSLLNSLTNAKGKVGDYPFTTLEPNLGECYGHIMADIPGLIEGASEGKGLGHKFLRHIKRTKELVHLVSLEHENPYDEYETVRKELLEYDPSLGEKKEIVVLTKTDMVDEGRVAEVEKIFAEKGISVLTLSLFDDEAIKHVRDSIIGSLSD